jgi:hypothetical protein
VIPLAALAAHAQNEVSLQKLATISGRQFKQKPFFRQKTKG